LKAACTMCILQHAIARGSVYLKYKPSPMRITLCLLTAFVVSHFLHAQPGILDNTFGVGGIADPPMPPVMHANIAGMAIQNDGYIVLSDHLSSSTLFQSRLYRLDTGGTADPGFNIIMPDAPAFEIAIQPDGKIVCASIFSNNYAIFRYLNNGTPDASFGTNGVVMLDFSGSGYGRCTSVELQQDGKILTAGYDGGTGELALARLKTNGEADSTFGVNGLLTNSNYGDATFPAFIRVQSNGNIMVVHSETNQFTIMSLLPNGTLNSAYGNGGIVNETNSSITIKGCLVQSDDKVVVGGNDADLHIYRYGWTGLRDSTFNTNGILILDGNSNSADYFGGIAEQYDGKIVVASSNSSATGYAVQTWRIRGNGMLDAGYGINGKTTTSMNTWTLAGPAAVQSDGKIVTFNSKDDGSGMYFVPKVMRYNVSCVSAVISVQPQDQQRCENESAYLTCASTGNISMYHWQMNTGSGFVGISNNSTFSGVTNDTLWLNNIPLSLNGASFRCAITDACEFSDTTSNALLTVDACAGVNETVTSVGVSVYPNPVNDVITVQVNSMEQLYSIMLCDLTGKLLLQEQISSNLHQLYVDKVIAGTYILQVTDSKGNTSQKKIVIVR